ncbi:putative F-box protein At1g60370 [Nicotiana sylvestris]|uniref:F-box protein At1g60370 n=1 Tax=Nicotiana sylvestris TaxID=4096 RepID=A0A1U7VPX4_NICSY|nr:PREDICTED: putative F-box protein At1g60370 [Nicotiana sylvestris]
MEKHCSEDIVFEILTWLPAKSLIRFKCISKTWNTLIGHPNLAKLHNTRSQVRPSATHLLFELGIGRDYINVYPVPKNRRVILGPKFTSYLPMPRFSLELAMPRHYSYLRICSNHCNGVVCLYNFRDTQVYLFNVTTREIKALPFSLNQASDPELFLGFDIVLGNYKLLHVFEESNNQLLKSRILTLGTDSWRKIYMPSNFNKPRRCIFLNGMLYSTVSPLIYFYFNFIKEKFEKLPGPQRSTCLTRLNIMQTALRGKLVMDWVFSQGMNQQRNMIYDDTNKVFKELNNSFPKLEKVAFNFEGEISFDETKSGDILATASIISTPASLVFPRPYVLRCVSSFVENIIPLSSLF